MYVIDVNNLGCCCSKCNVNMKEASEVGKFLCDLIDARKGHKATIKIELQFDN